MSTSNPGRQLLASLKQMAGHPCELVLPVGRPVESYLRTVATQRDRLNPKDLACLTEWRNRFVTSFLTEFEATEARTADWLVRVVGPDPGKILFMVDDPNGRTFGYMGLGFINWERMTGEADAAVRGAEAPPGAMGRAFAAMMTWAGAALGIAKLSGRVRSDNPSLPFFPKIGLVESHRVPLVRTEEPGLVRYAEGAGPPSGVSLVHMKWTGRSQA
jgi:hypothetical protein